MKKILGALLIAGLSFSASSQAQAVDPKQEWARKVVALQQGPDLDALVAQLANGAAQQMAGTWTERFDTSVPKARQAKASEEFNAELAKFAADANKIITAKVGQANSEALVPMYMERFTLEELRQLVTFFESPVVAKYKTATPDLVNVFVKKLIETTQSDIQARATQFDAIAEKIVGAPKAATPAKPAKK
ncbi:MAG TPA: DUF2059 domain-containing protein [Polaromonas sp.]|uniref:DUF2059 domain-containing protein n=1 Tax=Polaromonas sp. TaxID=1869339 RepID=UPI002D4122D0|nr:DUF2059 domain-containing protein [Polaromonas sp.]HYW57464.1 DUF2059 domain-containing protein [Polaromonas sp.]